MDVCPFNKSEFVAISLKLRLQVPTNFLRGNTGIPFACTYWKMWVNHDRSVAVERIPEAIFIRLNMYFSVFVLFFRMAVFRIFFWFYSLNCWVFERVVSVGFPFALLFGFERILEFSYEQILILWHSTEK